MDKKTKQRRQKTPTRDELNTDDATPRGASFDTEEGRAAQGMRPELGGPPDEFESIPLPPGAEIDRSDDPRREAEPKK
jgi:hypothetical protein